MKPRLTTALVLAALALGAAVPAASSAESCSPVVNPYPGTRYDGVDLSSIRAKGLVCPRARKVAKGAHSEALGITPPPSGVRRFRWRGWKVVGDLRSTSDRYTATRGKQRVRWRF